MPPSPLVDRFASNPADVPKAWHRVFYDGVEAATGIQAGAADRHLGDVCHTSSRRHRFVCRSVARYLGDVCHIRIRIRIRLKARSARARRLSYADRWQQMYRQLPDAPSGIQRADLLSKASECGLACLRVALDNYFGTSEDFVIDRRHPLALLLKQFSAWSAEAVA